MRVGKSKMPDILHVWRPHEFKAATTTNLDLAQLSPKKPGHSSYFSDDCGAGAIRRWGKGKPYVKLRKQVATKLAASSGSAKAV
jgi:hypothetical protein